MEVEIDLEDMAMNGNKIDKKREAMRAKRKKVEKLKRLVGMDAWDEDIKVSAKDAMEPVMNVLEFMKDPMIKGELTKDEFKTIHNGLIDAHEGIKMYHMRQEKKLKKV